MHSVKLLALVAAVVHASPIAELLGRQSSLFDSFYTPPAGWQLQPNGAVLNTRSIGTTLINANLVPRRVSAYQVLYKSSALDNSPISEVNTVFIPDFPQYDQLVSFQTPYDSAWNGSDPSLMFYKNNTPITVFDQAKLITIEAYLGNGWITGVSDYEGPDAAFTAGRLEGRGTLDGMRALGAFAKTKLYASSSPKHVGIGYSGGSIATGWAASLKASYANELNVVAWIIGGTPANISATLQFVDGGDYSGFGPIGIAGLTRPTSYGAQLAAFVKSIITPAGQAAVNFALTHDSSSSLANFKDKSVQSTAFQSLGARLLYTAPISTVLAQLTMGVNPSEAPKAPVLLYHASNDEIVPYGPAPKLYSSWCSQGSVVTFTTYASGGHITTAIFGLQTTVQFAKNAFSTTTTKPTACSQSTIYNNAIDNAALGGLENLGLALGQLGQQAGST